MTAPGATAGAITPAVAPLPAPLAADLTAERLERTIGLLLRRLRPLRPGDLTRSQASLLATVRDHGPLSLAELASLEAVQAPTASRAVETLVQRGLLRREPAVDDHRRHVIRLDGGAAELLAARSREAVCALAGALDGLDPARRVAVSAALPALDELVAALGGDVR